MYRCILFDVRQRAVFPAALAIGLQASPGFGTALGSVQLDRSRVRQSDKHWPVRNPRGPFAELEEVLSQV